jgi:hypothetical protein
LEDHQIPCPEEVRHPEDRPVVGFGQKVLPFETCTSLVASLVLWADDPRLSPKHPRHRRVVELAAVLEGLEPHRPEVHPFRQPLDHRPEEVRPFHRPLGPSVVLPVGHRPCPDLALIR